MESTETPQHVGGIVNYFQGATIHNIVINGNMTKRGTEHYYAAETTQSREGFRKDVQFSDEQVARAIEAICAEGLPLDTKQKWAGAYWGLRWYCNYPVKGSDFCDKIATLPFTKELDPECRYENIRKFVTLSFMNQDARQLDNVKPSKQDEKFYAECRTVVVALAQELGKASFPKI